MRADRGMAETVAAMVGPQPCPSCAWLSEEELLVYSDEYERTGFQGGLEHYRFPSALVDAVDLERYAGATLDAPSCIIAGERDWGFYMQPGLAESIPRVCTDLRGCHRLPQARHWVQQEAPEAYTRHLLAFLREVCPA